MIPTPGYLVDANVLLRVLTDPDHPHARPAEELFSRAATGELVLEVSAVIVAEVYYTLISHYRIDRSLAARNLAFLLKQPGVRLREAEQVLGALEILQDTPVAFADAFLAQGARMAKLGVVSFDRDFKKIKDVSLYEPV